MRRPPDNSGCCVKVSGVFHTGTHDQGNHQRTRTRAAVRRQHFNARRNNLRHFAMAKSSPEGSRERPVTMADLAREAGVSKITISRALSGHALVKDATRESIRKLAEDRGYRLNIAARNLRQQRTGTIAVVIEMTPSHDRSMSEPYPLSLLGAIMQELTSRDHNMVLTTMQMFCSLPPAADGVILLGQGMHEDAVEIVQRAGLPYVIWGSVDGNEAHVTVGSDNVYGGRLAAEHLLVQGRRKLIFVGDTTHLEVEDRLRGFGERIDEGGHGPVLSIVSPFTEAGGEQAMQSVLADGAGQFDGVFAASDAIAMGVISALTRAGLAVPDDVAVVGFDDAPGASRVVPPLTSIRQNWDRGGKLLANKILQLTAGGSAHSESMSVEIVRRAT
ncbi:LacI family DNA-binding transcriptional regulator [Glacieibacterium megasporae]|uniref:LacI family DNA-binding transcriptional regulator n=1 Tax=Glacieibacterium megasporae TaxID=2835787 RepID=UPI002107F1B7|nr:LacI family DNA-binding transcriptional regulator [Polymorphobacter megasporae]